MRTSSTMFVPPVIVSMGWSVQAQKARESTESSHAVVVRVASSSGMLYVGDAEAETRRGREDVEERIEKRTSQR